MTHQPTASESVRRLKGDTMALLARDLDCRREDIFTGVFSNGRGNYRLAVPEEADLECTPREQQKRTTLENVAHLILEIAALQKEAIAQHKQLSRYTISPMADTTQSERLCEERIDPNTGDIIHVDSRTRRRPK